MDFLHKKMNCNFIIFFAFTFIICLCFILFWYEYCPVYIFADSGSWRCVEGIHDKRLHVFWGIFAWLCIHNKLHWDIRKVKFIALVWFIFNQPIQVVSGAQLRAAEIFFIILLYLKLLFLIIIEMFQVNMVAK